MTKLFSLRRIAAYLVSQLIGLLGVNSDGEFRPA